MNKKEQFRKDLGTALKNIRIQRNQTLYSIAKQGDIDWKQAQTIENGSNNYTIDILSGYIAGAGLSMNFDIIPKIDGI